MIRSTLVRVLATTAVCAALVVAVVTVIARLT